MDRQQMLNEGRVFHLAADVMVPLIDQMKAHTDELLIRDFRSGHRDNLVLVAKLEALYTLKEEIITKAAAYEAHIKKGDN